MGWGRVIAALAVLALAPCVRPSAQEEPVKEGDEGIRGKKTEVVITATRASEDPFEVPRAITIIGAERLRRRNALSIIDNLNDSVGVWAEKRTSTTGDPVMRGLSGSNLLALIDGNSLSAFWGEGGFAGDDMYGKIDADDVERIEIVRGPSSVLWGSNALGGVVNFITRSPPLEYSTSGWTFGGRTKLTYGSAADEWRARQEMFGASPDFRYILGGSLRDVEDVEGGRGVGTQRPTGGEDKNTDFKGEWMVGALQKMELAIQSVHRTHIRRFYRPLEDNQNDRIGVSLAYKAERLTPFWDAFEGKVYRQEKKDQRRWFATGNRGVAVTQTSAASAQFTTLAGLSHRLIYGIQYQRDDGESPDDEQFTVTRPDGSKRKASPDSRWQDYGLYIQDEWDIVPALTATSSLRYDRFLFASDADEDYVPPGTWDPALDEYSDRASSLIGGLGLLYRAGEQIHLVANYARGYRLWGPRFGATQHGYGVVVPTMGFLDPVTGDTYEVGVKVRAERIAGSGFLYRTDFRNFQSTVPGTFQGSDWFDFDGDGVRDANESVYVVRDGGDAYVHGVELETEMKANLFASSIPEQWSLRSGFAWNIGKIRSDDQPLRHTTPAKGILAVRWDDDRAERGIWGECLAEFVRKFDRIPDDRIANDPGYRDNPRDMTSPLIRSDGHLPGYTVLHLRGGLNIAKNVALTLGIENLTDKKYRRAHSRWDEPGIDAIVGIEAIY